MTKKDLQNVLKYKLLERNILNDPDIFIEAFQLDNDMVVDKVTLYDDAMKVTLDPELMISVKRNGKEFVVFEYGPDGIDLILDQIRDNGTYNLLKDIDG